MLGSQIYESKREIVDPVLEKLILEEFLPQSALLVHGEYTVHPMQTCSEEDVAELFAQVSQRGNPVLQGRPFEDVKLLGRAMYRKSAKLGMGQVAKRNGKAVGLGCCWDAAEGGVWANSGLEMPASLAVHAAAGKACFDAMPKRNGKILFSAFYGMLPKHSAHCFSIMGVSQIAISQAMGFEYSFSFTLLPTLQGRKSIFSDVGASRDDSLNWAMTFADVASDRPDVLAELQKMDGAINLQLIRSSYNLSDEYMQLSATQVRMETGDELRRLVEVTVANHLKWLRSSGVEQSQNVPVGNTRIISRL